MLPRFRLSLGSPKAPQHQQAVPFEHEADILMNVAESLDSSYHSETFNYMAPPSPASPLHPRLSCTQPRTGELGLAADLGVPVLAKEDEFPRATEWRKKKAIEDERRFKESQQKHQQLLEQAKKEKQDFYTRRAARIAKTKAENRDKEKAYLASLDNLKNVGNKWAAVATLIEMDKHSASKSEGKRLVLDLGRPGTSSGGESQTDKFVKPGGETDLSRMRQVLLKLKRDPPKATKRLA